MQDNKNIDIEVTIAEFFESAGNWTLKEMRKRPDWNHQSYWWYIHTVVLNLGITLKQQDINMTHHFVDDLRHKLGQIPNSPKQAVYMSNVIWAIYRYRVAQLMHEDLKEYKRDIVRKVRVWHRTTEFNKYVLRPTLQFIGDKFFNLK